MSKEIDCFRRRKLTKKENKKTKIPPLVCRKRLGYIFWLSLSEKVMQIITMDNLDIFCCLTSEGWDSSIGLLVTYNKESR